MNNVKYEYELYAPMCGWLEQQLKDKYKHYDCDIIVEDTHSVYLDSILTKHGVISSYPQAVGIQIQIDVLGIVKFKNGTSDLVFIEAKKTELNIQDLGQLRMYCDLINPSDAYLLSSKGLGHLDKILKNFSREDMLDFGSGKTIKKIKVAKWDIAKKSPDYNSMVPKM